MLFDGCEDDSYAVAMDVINRSSAWPQCNYTAESLDESRVWAAGKNWTSSQGDIGQECRLAPSSLVSVRFINNTGAGLQNTAGDNIKMLASRAKYYILVDDDQFMTVNGWNVKASYPLRRWPEVFSASMRCAHGFPEARGHVYGAKCANTYARQFRVPAKCFFYIADSSNRGPLILRAEYVRQMGYLDEVLYMGVNTNGRSPTQSTDSSHEFGTLEPAVAYAYVEPPRDVG